MYIQRRDIKAYSNLSEYMCIRAKSSGTFPSITILILFSSRVNGAETVIKEMKDVVHL